MSEPRHSQDAPLIGVIWGEQEMCAFDRAVIENTMNAVIACDANSNLVVFNPTARAWHGLDARNIPPEEWASYYRLYLPDGVTPFPAEDVPLIRAFRGETVRNVPLVICAEGQLPRYVSCGGGPFFDADGVKLGAFVVMVDTTEVHELTLELQHLASHDALTELPNRRTFESEVQRATLFAGRGVVSTVLFADVDRFKTCNDLLGHVVGDTVLREIAHSMREVVRDIDMVARIGGDEFGIVLWDRRGDVVKLVSRRLSDAVAEVGRAHGLDIGLSMGASVIAPDSDASKVLAEADARMYEMKKTHQA